MTFEIHIENLATRIYIKKHCTNTIYASRKPTKGTKKRNDQTTRLFVGSSRRQNSRVKPAIEFWNYKSVGYFEIDI